MLETTEKKLQDDCHFHSANLLIYYIKKSVKMGSQKARENTARSLTAPGTEEGTERHQDEEVSAVGRLKSSGSPGRVWAHLRASLYWGE